MPRKSFADRSAAFLFWFIFATRLTLAQPADSSKPVLRLFMIGNSFSQNASRYLPQLSEEGGHKLIIGRAEIGGSSLQRHWTHVEAAEQNPADSMGKPYKGKSLKMLLSEGTWDVITIQQASILSGNVSTYEPYARKLYDYVRKLQPQATVVIHQTWAYRSDSKDFSQITASQSAKNAEAMWTYSRAAYHATADELALPIIPNGDAFWRMTTRPRWAYHPDTRYDYAHPSAPALPDQTHSLHVGYRWDKDKLAFDSHHANAAGCYLGSLVWYGFLFNESPVRLRFRPEEVDEAFARQLRKTAWSTVRKARRQLKHHWAGVGQSRPIAVATVN